jgi:pantoate--beta-alanine ligase
MLEITAPAEMQQHALELKRGGTPVAFVPTMGALHDGHLSLMKLAKQQSPGGKLVVSIFVNPAQFGKNEDLANYPRPLARDRELCEQAGVDLLFRPSANDIYPPGFATFVEPGPLGSLFEGAIRPGHFRGVATVVLKLFNLVQPDVAVFGQKDAQQVAVLKQLVRDLSIPVELLIGSTHRELDGLALSSRNVYLNPAEREAAPCLNLALRAGAALIRGGERKGDSVRSAMEKIVRAQPLARLDYAEVVRAGNFSPLDELKGEMLLIIAAKFGNTRLIDNEPVTIA